MKHKDMKIKLGLLLFLLCVTLCPAWAQSFSVTGTKVDETTVKLLGFYWCSEELVGTVDVAALTITFQPQTVGSYYTFAQETDEQAPVVATIAEDGTIQIKGWGAWYGGYTYIEGAQTQLSKQ